MGITCLKSKRFVVDLVIFLSGSASIGTKSFIPFQLAWRCLWMEWKKVVFGMDGKKGKMAGWLAGWRASA